MNIQIFNIYFGILIFFTGASIGSFINVLIYRIPRKESFISSPSKCPNCHKRILWYENIPILSYIFLKGKCSGCKQKISIQYPLIELLFGSIFLLTFLIILSNT